MHDDDHQLMARIAAGDRDAFAALFRRHGARVEGYLCRSLPASAAAEVTQEVFLRIWRHADRYDPRRAAPTTWMFTIVRNARIDRVRRRARPEPDPDDPMWVPSAPMAPDAVAQRHSQDQAVRARVNALPEAQRQVIAMAYLEGRSLPEIAEALEVPLGTVKSRVRLAMARLRDDAELPDPDDE